MRRERGDVVNERLADVDAVEATLTSSRALLGVVARSVADALHDVTLPQFRVLVVLSTVGTLRIGALAERMSANPSTFSRTIDRMVTHGWVDRATSVDSRREVLIQITEKGRALVDQVTVRRRHDIAEILGRLAPAEQRAVSAALALFAEASGEPQSKDLLVLGL
jgi:DNA-binding MarR family transcriptional regulator